MTECGRYWKIPEHLEFDVEVIPAGNLNACMTGLRALQPKGWSGDVWNNQDDGSVFLLPDIRWAWLTTDDE